MIIFLAVLCAACGLGATFIFPRAALLLWLLALETSPDAWLDRIAGISLHETIIGALKADGLVILAAVMLRAGGRRDRFNPAFGFATMFLAGLAHGLYPALTLLSSLRSLIGSAGPFLFSFCRLPADFCRTAIWAALWGPLCAVGFTACMALAGIDHAYVFEQGALRLGSAGEPPFLAGFALIGIYAALVEFFAGRQRAGITAVVVNLIIVLLTGARAPLAIACFDILAALIMIGRIVPLAAAGAVGAAALLLSSSLSFLRVVDLTNLGELSNLSNRDLIWPYFEKAFWASPLFGWGTGAGKVIVPVNWQMGSLLGTNAAHNEYLRLGAEGGAVGLLLLIILMVLWVCRGTPTMPRRQAWMVRLIFVGFAVHSATDNTMIATTSSVFFLWASCIFAQGLDYGDAARAGAALIPGRQIQSAGRSTA